MLEGWSLKELRVLLCFLCGIILFDAPRLCAESRAARANQIDKKQLFSVVDRSGHKVLCATVKKHKIFVKKQAQDYITGAEQIRAFQSKVKAAQGKAAKKLKTQLAALRAAVAAKNTACSGETSGSASLKPLQRALTRADVTLLLNRAGFGLGENEESLVSIAQNQGIAALVDAFMQTKSESAGLIDRVLDRRDGVLGSSTTQSGAGQRQAILDLWIHTNNPYAEKMAMFLLSVWTVSNEVIEDETFRGSFWDYYQRLRDFAYNNPPYDQSYLKDLAIAITEDPFMLIYLNNELNVKDAPNENYARELMELFTLGPSDLDGNPNYTETQPDGSGDIAVAAKMLTGWTVHKNYITNRLDTVKDNSRHAAGPHEMFKSKSYHFSGDDDADLINGIFSKHPGVKHYYAKEILKAYLNPNPPRNLVEAFGKVIQDNNFNLRPAMRSLFMSEAFYDPAYQHTVPVDPYDMIARAARILRLQGAVNVSELEYDSRGIGYMPNQPPSVFWFNQDAWSSAYIQVAKSNLIAALCNNHSGQNSAGWTLSKVLPSGTISNAALIEFIRSRTGVSAPNTEQTQAILAYISMNRDYTGTYVPFTYNNTNSEHQRAKGLGIYNLLMMSPDFQLN